jgi:predicted DNA-binding transcriptional regulator AlpA
MAEAARRLRTTEAAAHCGLSRRTLEKLRVLGGGPVYMKIGRAVVYDVDDLEAWLAAHRRRSTSDAGSSDTATV